MNTVSLIIPNRNGRHFLRPCLESLRQQTRTPDEIIVVDNGSTDGSQGFLRKQYPGVSVLELGYNAGFSVAMNRGVEAASGGYVALLNNDTECDPQWLEKLAEALGQHPDIGFCATKMLHFDRRELIDTAGDIFSTGGFFSSGEDCNSMRDSTIKPSVCSAPAPALPCTENPCLTNWAGSTKISTSTRKTAT